MVKKKNSFILTFLFIVTLTLLLIFSIYTFKDNLDESLNANVLLMLQETSNNHTSTLKSKIEGQIVLLKSISDYFATFESTELTHENIVNNLISLKSITEFNRLGLTFPSAVCHLSDGGIYDISDRDYFQKAIKGEITISEPFDSKIDAIRTVAIAVPIIKNNDIIGIIHGSYSMETLDKTLSTESFNNRGYALVVAANGEIIARSGSNYLLTPYGNIFDLYSNFIFENGFSVNLMKEDLKNNVSGFMSYSYNIEERLATYAPLGINNWYIFSIVPKFVVTTQSEEISLNLYFFIIKIVIGFIAFVLYIVLSNKINRKKLQKAYNSQEVINKSIPGAVQKCFIDGFFTLKYVSDGFYDLTGYTRKEMDEKFNSKFINMIFSPDLPLIINTLENNFNTEYELEYRIFNKDGELLWIHNKGQRIIDDDGDEVFLSVLLDVTNVKAEQERLKVSEEHIRLISEQSDSVIFEYNIKNDILSYSNNFKRIFGKEPTKINFMKSKTAIEFIHKEDIHLFYAICHDINKSKNKELTQIEIRLKKSDETFLWSLISLTVLLNNKNEPYIVVGKITNINEQKLETQVLKRKAELDPLTGIYNKLVTQNLINEFLKSNEANGKHALMIIDIDDFKGVNDNLGHAFGDAVLTEISTKIKKISRSSDIIGRIGGDEFVIFLKNLDNNLLDEKAKEVCNTFRKTFTGDNKDYKISGSIGIAIYKEHGKNFKELYNNADIALYAAKNNGKDCYSIYNPNLSKVIKSNKRRNNDIIFNSEISNMSIENDIKTYIFEILYNARDLESSIRLILGILGEYFNVSRVYIFENNLDNKYTSNTFEWCNKGISSHINNLQNIPYPTSMSTKEIYACSNIETLETKLYEILKPQEIKSILIVPIEENQQNRGFIGFDDCENNREWTQKEITIFKDLGKIIGSFLLKKRISDEVLNLYEKQKNVLDSIENIIYVINSETYEILYANKKVKGIESNLSIGDICYKTFWKGKDRPCENCPVSQLKISEKSTSVEFYNDIYNIWCSVTASKIVWNSSDNAVLVCCNDISQYKE